MRTQSLSRHGPESDVVLIDEFSIVLAVEPTNLVDLVPGFLRDGRPQKA